MRFPDAASGGSGAGQYALLAPYAALLAAGLPCMLRGARRRSAASVAAARRHWLSHTIALAVFVTTVYVGIGIYTPYEVHHAGIYGLQFAVHARRDCLPHPPIMGEAELALDSFGRDIVWAQAGLGCRAAGRPGRSGRGPAAYALPAPPRARARRPAGGTA